MAKQKETQTCRTRACILPDYAWRGFFKKAILHSLSQALILYTNNDSHVGLLKKRIKSLNLEIY